VSRGIQDHTMLSDIGPGDDQERREGYFSAPGFPSIDIARNSVTTVHSERRQRHVGCWVFPIRQKLILIGFNLIHARKSIWIDSSDSIRFSYTDSCATARPYGREDW